MIQKLKIERGVFVKPINVNNEIGRLKKVLLHRPGQELENLMPEYLERLLFDDIPYLKIAQEEHDAFANVLKNNGVEVVYLEDLSAESLVNHDVKKMFIDEYLRDAGIWNMKNIEVLSEYFLQLDKRNLIDKMMAGLRKSDLKNFTKRGLKDYLDNDYPFIIDPMPNLYFTRDPFASIADGISLHKMRTQTRNRETLFTKYIMKHHPDFAKHNIPFWYDREDRFALEGGDILILNKYTIAIGISQRTDTYAIEIFADKILRANNDFNTILAFDIPKHRSFMHLDTIFTMVDKNKFTIHPNIQGSITVYSLTLNEGKIRIDAENDQIKNILSRHLNLDSIELIKCGGSSSIDAAREQWNDGSNTLAISPGEVVVYSRNYVTNTQMEERGIKTHIIPCSELSRGRGGPRCMSMPLVREELC